MKIATTQPFLHYVIDPSFFGQYDKTNTTKTNPNDLWIIQTKKSSLAISNEAKHRLQILHVKGKHGGVL